MAARHPYGRGDVILIQFPFSSATGQKDRPAIVMSTEYTTTAGMNCWSWPSLPSRRELCALQIAHFNIGRPLGFNNLHGCVPISPPFIVSW